MEPAAERRRPAQDWAAPVVVLAPAGRDGDVAAAVLMRAGFNPVVCHDMESLCSAIVSTGDAGALLIAEEALTADARDTLLATLAAQPAWSDLPIVVLTGEGELSGALSPALEAVTAATNSTLLERPVRVATLVTALRSALRARRRQIDVRDHLRERAAAEEALKAARADALTAQVVAEQANRAKSDFLAAMSHELRTPLNAIGGHAQLLSMGLHGELNDAQREALDRIDRAQRHLLGLINNILNLAKLEAASVAFDITTIAVSELVESVMPMIEPQLAQKGVAHEVRVDDPALMVLADRDKLVQVLLNLLANAVKFTPALRPDGVQGRVTLAVTTRDGGDGPVDFRVSDTGIGIPADKLHSIFEPFVQVKSTWSERNAGTGLGLTISRDLARGMGGELTVASELGKGSTFTLTLPQPPSRR